MVWSNLLMGLLLYFCPYYIMITTGTSSYLAAVAAGLISAVGFTMLGSIQHHSGHKSLHPSPAVNKWGAYLMDMLGMSSLNWHVKHNLLHHQDTNILGYDRDITSGEPLLLFAIHAKVKKAFHRYQHIYGVLAYAMAFFSWILLADWRQLRQYHKIGKIKGDLKHHMIRLGLHKVVYLFFWLGLPVLLGVPFSIALTLWATMVAMAGIMLMPVFQVAHVVEELKQFSGPPNGEEKVDIYLHMMRTTADFQWSRYTWINKIFFHMYGGLDHQTIHHMFRDVNYVHYPAIRKILESLVCEFRDDAPEYHRDSFWKLLASHWRMLKKIGTEVDYMHV